MVLHEIGEAEAFKKIRFKMRSDMSDQIKMRPTGISTMLLWIGITAVVLLLLLGMLNNYLNPLSFQTSSLREVAKTLNSEQNFALDDPNIDFRAIRREHIHLMQEKLDVVLFAGSRFEVASSKTFPGRTFYNAFAHNDYFEDLLAVTTLLEEANRLPTTLVLSVRHLSFRPIAQRETDEWKMFSAEYLRMASRLGIPAVPLFERFPLSHYQSMFSIELLKHGLARAMHKTELAYGPTALTSAEDRDILHSDGSLTFSKKHIGTFTSESARVEAMEQATRLRSKMATVPTSADAQSLEKLLRHLIAKGVQPVIAITPHHPAFWDGVQSYNYGKSLIELESRVKKIAQKTNAVYVGSFDPRVAGCRESSFRDYIHLDEACLKTIFDQIPAPSLAL